MLLALKLEFLKSFNHTADASFFFFFFAYPKSTGSKPMINLRGTFEL